MEVKVKNKNVVYSSHCEFRFSIPRDIETRETLGTRSMVNILSKNRNLKRDGYKTMFIFVISQKSLLMKAEF
jgi:hypothetical protein